MTQNTGENITNMIKCRKGEHCLFRSFGLGAYTDNLHRITRSTLQVEVNRWFPGNTIVSFSTQTANEKGEFLYNIDVRGL